jgi:hypothetical protein
MVQAEQLKIEALPQQDVTLPRAGQPWPSIEGAIYAGLVPGFLNEPDYHLVLLADEAPARMKWAGAVSWAQSLGAELPSRNESAFLYAFHREQFSDDEWYWTGTQYSSGDAWAQDFHDGYQDDIDKSSECRARAVRRFNASILRSFEAAQVAEAA